ncbi:hypothetical protein D9758_013873 [Tetrapyrgos nigripes]|uniref:Zn(2)-C6 fungal-type domain-containing protein n=1 Tax=Tetrapyrgos nigripes TaxID=182062 RepID=A0A8H5FQL9_9AGAR|nr:hypothetical protein D9758_013873 [Tetrapyrgos nigripes]
MQAMGSDMGGKKTRMPRGSSCLNCRRRRIKCDALRPTCSNCERSLGKFYDCEYGDGGPPQAEYLQEQISIMESRVRELEDPSQPLDSMVLHNPYGGFPARASPAAPSVPRGSRSIELSPQLRKVLLSTFFRHAPQLGFFLDNTRLFNSASGSPITQSALSPALLQTILLLGAHLSSYSRATSGSSGTQNDSLEGLRATLLSKAINSTSQILSSNHPDKVLQAIQTHVLLTHYFYMNGRKLEGRYHLSMAVSLVISTRMHRTRSRDELGSSDSLRIQVAGLPGPANFASQNLQEPRHEKERIDAFWTVLSMNSCWTTLEGTVSSLMYRTPQMRVDTPWPGVPLSPDTRSSSTIEWFLANVPDGDYSMLALHAKASILFEQAFTLEEFDANASMESIQTRSQSYNSLCTLVQRFQSELPPIVGTSANSAVGSVDSTQIGQLLLIRTLICVGKIRLAALSPPTPYTYTYGTTVLPDSPRQIALEVVELIRNVHSIFISNFTWDVDKEMFFVDPILAVLWTMVGQTLAQDVERIETGTIGVELPRQARITQLDELRRGLDTIIRAMSIFGAASRPLLDQQLQILLAGRGSGGDRGA